MHGTARRASHTRGTRNTSERGVPSNHLDQPTMNVKIEESWKQHLGAEFDKPYFTALTQQVRQEYQGGPCYPPGNLIFNAFNLCPFDQVKVVIIGQDP